MARPSLRSFVESRSYSTHDSCTVGKRRLHNSAAVTDSPITHGRRRLRAVVVGSGPSGFYTAKYLTSSVNKRIAADRETATSSSSSSTSSSSWPFSGIDIDILERLPTPYGLVRYGVAPDHPEVKNVENDFAAVPGNTHSRAHGGGTVSYFGNVDVGRHVSLSTLSALYDVVVLAYGCQSDRGLTIPGLDLRGVLTARQFVNWYNGHPEFGYVADIVREALWDRDGNNAGDVDDADNGAISKAKAVVIGNGNVALDCARILAKGRRGLKDTDVPSSVLDVLGDGVEKVVVVGRRGHVQGAFTIKELRELTKLQKEGYDVSFRVRQEELDMGMTEASLQELQLASGRPKMRIDALLREAAATTEEEGEGDHEAPTKTIELRLLMNPIRIESNNNRNNPRVHHVIFERTQLQGEPGKQLSVGTGQYEKISADLVILSVGYKGSPLEGMNENMFDSQRGIVVNNQGKVCGDNNLFVVGWIKRSPTGIIGSNIMDAKETVASIMKYIDSNPQNLLALHEDSDDDLSKGSRGLIRHLEANNVKYVTWDQFLQIDQAERDRDRLRNDVQPREKFLSVDEMLACLQSTC
ncbi:hypothetical protein HJC23_005582 [Cyclotella cryptica]|uniref:adrenodoxin-NADP(+) reductase n=1 Tax=Cyclotella cryptica TaxID=29204 RepID=A0ABD3PPZ9_9STRA